MLGSEQEGKPLMAKARPSPRLRWNRELVGLAVVLIALIILAGIVSNGLFFTPDNIRNMLLRGAVVGIVAVGQAFAMLSSGIDLSVGGSLVLASCIGAGLMTTDPRVSIVPGGHPLPIAVGIIAMLLVAACVGAGNGLSVSRLRMSPLIVTLAIWQITYGAAYQTTSYGQLIANIPDSLGVFGQGNIGGVPVAIIIFALVVIAAYFILNHTTFGRSIYAVGGSETSARLSGINVKSVRTWVYVVCGVCVGIGAVIALSRTLCASISMVPRLEIDSITACVIGGVSLFGGKGSIVGVLLGVLIFCVIDNTMTLKEVMPFHQDIIRGCVILIAVAASFFTRRRTGLQEV
jgi:ribose/xylose/arabinose/galactoside ABC-type transport system permease subunit